MFLYNVRDSTVLTSAFLLHSSILVPFLGSAEAKDRTAGRGDFGGGSGGQGRLAKIAVQFGTQSF